MLDLTGDSQTITVTDDTTYEKEAAPEKPEEARADAKDEKADDNKDDADSSNEKADDSKDDADVDSTDEKSDDSTDETTDTKDDESKTAGDEKPEDGQAPEMKTESIAFSDIQVGDVIKVTLDADGNATAVVVMNSGAPEKANNLS